MAVELEVSLIDAQFRTAMARLLAGTVDLKPLMEQIAGQLAAASERLFESEAGPDGIPWPDLQQSTKDARARIGKWPGKLLQVSGETVSSIVGQSDADFAEVAIGSPQAAFLHLGTRHMPARPIVGIDAQAETDIRDSAVAYLEGLTEG